MTQSYLSLIRPLKKIIEKEPRRKPQPADWGLGTMTGGIAALCESTKNVVAVSDEMITFDFVSADSVAMKNWPLSLNWSALYASLEQRRKGQAPRLAIEIDPR